MSADEGDRVGSAYGPNWDELARIKAAYDPENRFRMNQNIQPKKPAGR
jgi:FAD/FMN-containing dehydrogenase